MGSICILSTVVGQGGSIPSAGEECDRRMAVTDAVVIDRKITRDYQRCGRYPPAARSARARRGRSRVAR